MSALSWEGYAFGYKRAGDLLLKRFLTRGELTSGERCVVIYPLLFLYRHYIELRLKEAMENGKWILSLLGTPTSSSADYQHHRIDLLWRECRCILDEIDKEELASFSEDQLVEHRELYSNLQDDIGIFSKLDPGSTAFRYPTSRDGHPSLPGGEYLITQIGSWDNLQALVQRISYWLDGISVGLDETFRAIHEGHNSARL